MVKKNVAVFISGRGSNLNKLIINSFLYNFPVNIKYVISSNKKARGLNYARKNLIPYFIFDEKNKLEEIKLIQKLKDKKIDLICLSGYMRILSKNLIKSFRNRIINIHPSLLPKFKGLNTYKRVIRKKEKKTGCTVHFVNEKLDDGKIILQKAFYISNKDDELSLKKKTQKLEYKVFSEAIIKLFNLRIL
tara:strand:+ start:1222 stop:1791 length:570 start_codon:yes stop_codon:yes gene_type:complete